MQRPGGEIPIPHRAVPNFWGVKGEKEIEGGRRFCYGDPGILQGPENPFGRWPIDTDDLFDPYHPRKAPIIFLIFVVILVLASLSGWLIQTDLGRIEVSNVIYQNYNGIPIRAKLLRPVSATPATPAPGVVYIHGYQNNRETGDAYSIELARRGFVVLNIDAIGRGNSGEPNHPRDANFDPTFGGTASIKYLRSLSFVKVDSVGIVGHSLGAEMAYRVALSDPTIRALVITGFAYTTEASPALPKNMLMIMGKWDEFRQRMTGTRDLEKEWMKTEQTRRVFPVADPKLDETYGDFARGTGRRVFIPRITHVQESHNSASIAETVEWMRNALRPDGRSWVKSSRQTWMFKEGSNLVAMFACLAAILPLGLMLLRTHFFASLRGTPSGSYACSLRAYLKHVSLNGILLWLYLPLILVLFGVHKYLAPIDRLFPMMMVNGIVWWFLGVNLIGFFFLRRWYRRQAPRRRNLSDLGVSWEKDRMAFPGLIILKTALLGGVLFAFAYLSEYTLERIWIVDFRFVWPFASDLTPYRWCMFLLYLPFLFVCFLLTGPFLHGLLRRPRKETWLKTFAHWSFWNILALVGPLLLLLGVQYVPLFTTGFIPFEGPGGLFAVFMISLFHTLALLAITSVLSTYFFQVTGKIYLGALVNALLVAWIFASSQVIAPIPV
jgi:dienelactone hydrolase